MHVPDDGPVGRPGRAAAGRRVAALGRRRRCPSTSSPVPAICSNGTRPRRSAPPPRPASSSKGVSMGLVDEAEFHFFHFFPYTDLPGDHRRYESLWVDFSNANYDPQVGHDLYNRYLSEMVLADRLGYDGLVLNEHHNTQYSMNPAPNLTAAALIPQTQRVDQRVRHAAEPRLPEPPGRGVRHARRDVRRAAARRLPARHRHGVLGERGQPGDRPGPLPRVDRHHPALLDRGRPAELQRGVLHLPLPQPVAEADAEAVPGVLHRRHRFARDDRAGGRAGLRVHGGVHPDQGRSCRCSTTTANASPTTATTRRRTR